MITRARWFRVTGLGALSPLVTQVLAKPFGPDVQCGFQLDHGSAGQCRGAFFQRVQLNREGWDAYGNPHPMATEAVRRFRFVLNRATETLLVVNAPAPATALIAALQGLAGFPVVKSMVVSPTHWANELSSRVSDPIRHKLRVDGIALSAATRATITASSSGDVLHDYDSGVKAKGGNIALIGVRGQLGPDAFDALLSDKAAVRLRTVAGSDRVLEAIDTALFAAMAVTAQAT